MSLPILDVAIGLSFIYLLLALVCTSVNELIAGALNKRGKFLEKGILRLLGGDAALKKALYEHPMVQGTTPDGNRTLPAYISPKRFAAALLDHLTGPEGSRFNRDDLCAAINRIQNPSLRTSLQSLAPTNEPPDPFMLQAAVEEWFNEGMDRVSGWYKRNSQLYVLILATLVTIGLNADSLHMARVLWMNPTLRTQFVEEAKIRASAARPEELLPLYEYEDTNEPLEAVATVKLAPELSKNEINLLSQVMGWGNEEPKPEKTPSGPRQALALLATLIGWAITAAAVSLGGPFWFDTLNRFINIRNAGRSPNESRDKTAPAAKS